jgi:hypothetical protein
VNLKKNIHAFTQVHQVTSKYMYTHELYNSLPSLRDARERFKSIEGGPGQLLKSLAPLFKNHPGFGVCLVHTHCELTNGEKMVSTGRITEPVTIDDGKCFPERWLSNGVPFEFNSSPTVKGGLPTELVESFYTHLKSFGENDLSDLLGIYYVHDRDFDTERDEDIIWVDRTEGRTNIVEPKTREDAFNIANAVPAAWLVSKHADADPEFMVSDECEIICVEADDEHYDKDKCVRSKSTALMVYTGF